MPDLQNIDPQSVFLAAFVGAFVLLGAVLGFVSIWSQGPKKKT